MAAVQQYIIAQGAMNWQLFDGDGTLQGWHSSSRCHTVSSCLCWFLVYATCALADGINPPFCFLRERFVLVFGPSWLRLLQIQALPSRRATRHRAPSTFVRLRALQTRHSSTCLCCTESSETLTTHLSSTQSSTLRPLAPSRCISDEQFILVSALPKGSDLR